MRRMLFILALTFILTGSHGLLPRDGAGYIGPPVVVRLCQIWPGLCLPQ